MRTSAYCQRRYAHRCKFVSVRWLMVRSGNMQTGPETRDAAMRSLPMGPGIRSNSPSLLRIHAENGLPVDYC